MLTDRGAQFYASEAEERERGSTVFERYLIENEIRHVLSRVSHPQTNGKIGGSSGRSSASSPGSATTLTGSWFGTTRRDLTCL
jgi:transposase InsO family protein